MRFAFVIVIDFVIDTIRDTIEDDSERTRISILLFFGFSQRYATWRQNYGMSSANVLNVAA